MDLVKALWRGDIPLVVTYWLYGVLGSLLLRIPLLIWEEYPPTSPVLAGVVLAYFVMIVVYTVFIAVAIWRAATKYKGSSWWWSGLAKIAVVAGVVSMMGELAKAIR